MNSDFVASILIKCHKNKGSREIFTSWIYVPKNLLNEASDSQFSAYDPIKMEQHWKPSSGIIALPVLA